MAISGKNKLGLTLFATITLLFGAYVVAFSVYQFYREQQYKENLAGVRVTIIGEDGRVLMDTERDAATMPNHLNRHEVQQALREGYGFDISRSSETDGKRYFYSATYSPTNHQIIRSAVPYPGEESESPITNRGYIIVAVAIFLVLTIVLFLYTWRIGRHVDATIAAYKEQVREAEEDKNRIKRQLTQNAAHELKTPASSIHGYLESILDNPDMPADQRQHFLERCYAQSERMNKLLMDMSALTKLEAPHPEGENQTTQVDLIPIIHNALDDTALQLKEKNLTVLTHLPEQFVVDSPLAEPEQALYGIFRNLIDNALAYATGATQIQITCRGREFVFADNGVGVEHPHLDRIFERFYRVDKGRSRALGGTGLGLAIVKNTITAHGGTCVAETTPGGGLTIRFTIL